jgi:hypothetical protein
MRRAEPVNDAGGGSVERDLLATSEGLLDGAPYIGDHFPLSMSTASAGAGAGEDGA